MGPQPRRLAMFRREFLSDVPRVRRRSVSAIAAAIFAVIEIALANGCGGQETPTADVPPTATDQTVSTIVPPVVPAVFQSTSLPSTAVSAPPEPPKSTTIPSPTTAKPTSDLVVDQPVEELAYGGSVQGEIDIPGGHNFYSFQASAGDQVTLVPAHDGNPGVIFGSTRQTAVR